MTASHHNSPIALLSKKNPWMQNHNRIWLSSSLSLFRNLEKFNFPAKLDTSKQKTLVSLVGDELLKVDGLANPHLFPADTIGPIDKEFLTEHFLSIENFHQAHAGEAFILDDSGTFMTTINLHDHIHLQLMECEGELEKAWHRLIKVETTLGKSLNYAYSRRYGFLTTDPSDCGTAMSAAVYLQLPALMHTEKIDDILETTLNDSISITGMQGSPTEIIGDILVIKNQYCLGVSEENILATVRNMTMKLLLEENTARTAIRNSGNNETKDRISRAYGILIHSYQIEAIEALNALSLIKLGVDLNWIEGIDIATLNELFFNCRRAHLLCSFDKKIEPEELGRLRAEFIHRALEGVELQI